MNLVHIVGRQRNGKTTLDSKTCKRIEIPRHKSGDSKTQCR